MRRVWAIAATLTLLATSAISTAWAQPAGPAPRPPGGANPPAAPLPPNGPVPDRVAAAAPAPAAIAPFQLTPPQQAALDALLLKWEQRGAGVQNLQAGFVLWEDNPTFNLVTKHGGLLKYKSPDRGEYAVTEVFESAADDAGKKPFEGERWCCDGSAVYQFDAREKIVVKHELPSHLRGQAIQHSPLPFLFNAKAEQLKSRYFLRDVTSGAERQKNKFWIEAHPRYQQDAANFKFATIILDGASFLPVGLRLALPDGGAQGRDHTKTYAFSGYKLNENKLLGLFGKQIGDPSIPSGWTTRVEAAVEPGTTVAPPAPTKSGPLGGLLPKK